MPRCGNLGNARRCPVGWLLANSGSHFSIHFLYSSLPEFPLIFFRLFLYIVMIFCCNVYEAFLCVFSSKTNVKNAPSLPALLDFCACWMQVSHTNTSVCVKLIHCCVTVHACWTFSYSHASAYYLLQHHKAILIPRPGETSTSTAKPRCGICPTWLQSWADGWSGALTAPLRESGWGPGLSGLPTEAAIPLRTAWPREQLLQRNTVPTLFGSLAIWQYGG